MVLFLNLNGFASLLADTFTGTPHAVPRLRFGGAWVSLPVLQHEDTSLPEQRIGPSRRTAAAIKDRLAGRVDSPGNRPFASRRFGLDLGILTPTFDRSSFTVGTL